MFRLNLFLLIAFSIFISACSTNKFDTPYAETYKKYQAIYTGNQVSQSDLDKFSKLFSDFENNNSFEQRVRDFYAEELYFNDTFSSFTNIDELVTYLKKTASHGVGVEVSIDDIASNNNDYYVRWTMDLIFSENETLTSVGMTHLRFDKNKKVVLHQDYWDGVEGFYQSVPVVGYLVKQVRNRL